MNRARLVSFSALLGASSALLVACVGLIGDFDVDGSDAAVDAHQEEAADTSQNGEDVGPRRDAAPAGNEGDAHLPEDSSLADGTPPDASSDGALDGDASSHDASDAGPADAAIPDAGPPDTGLPDAGPPDTGPVGSVWDHANWNQSLWQ